MHGWASIYRSIYLSKHCLWFISKLLTILGESEGSWWFVMLLLCGSSDVTLSAFMRLIKDWLRKLNACSVDWENQYDLVQSSLIDEPHHKVPSVAHWVVLASVGRLWCPVCRAIQLPKQRKQYKAGRGCWEYCASSEHALTTFWSTFNRLKLWVQRETWINRLAACQVHGSCKWKMNRMTWQE